MEPDRSEESGVAKSQPKELKPRLAISGAQMADYFRRIAAAIEDSQKYFTAHIDLHVEEAALAQAKGGE